MRVVVINDRGGGRGYDSSCCPGGRRGFGSRDRVRVRRSGMLYWCGPMAAGAQIHDSADRYWWLDNCGVDGTVGRQVISLGTNGR